MCNESNVFILFNFLWGCYGGALVFLGGAGAPASPSLAPPMAAGKLEYEKAYIQRMEILHYIDVVRRKDDLNTDVLLWYYTGYPHPSDHDTNCITRIKNICRK